MSDAGKHLPRRVVVSREVRKRQAAPGRVSNVITDWLPWADDDTLAMLIEAAQSEVKRRQQRALADRLAMALALDERARTNGDNDGGTAC